MSKRKKALPKSGRCCGCGYDGDEETPCPARTDGTHCVHWWDVDGEEVATTSDTDEDLLQAALAESQARVEEYRREVERRDELLAGADADLRESQAREAALTKALRRLVAAVDDDVGHEDDNYRPQSAQVQRAVDQAESALASPSAAAQALLERVAELEQGRAVEEYGTEEAFKQRDQALADRDRWLRHVRALVPLFGAPGVDDDWMAIDAARRDLAQADGEGT